MRALHRDFWLVTKGLQSQEKDCAYRLSRQRLQGTLGVSTLWADEIVGAAGAAAIARLGVEVAATDAFHGLLVASQARLYLGIVEPDVLYLAAR